MVAEVVDYRVSRLVVLCKDCGHDVGLYPARHKCKISDANAPPLPSMPKQYSSNKSNTNKQSNDNNTSEQSSAASLWTKLKTVNNWREMAEDDSVIPVVGTKLWGKLLSAASSAYSAIDENSDNDSEKEDWEGETHISRILREYHQQKTGDIPDWLYDPKPIPSQNNSTKNSTSSQINKIPPPNKIPNEDYKNSLPNNSTSFHPNDNNNNKGRKPRIYDEDNNNNKGRKPRNYDEDDNLLKQNQPAPSTRSMNRSRSANNLSNRINNPNDQRNFVPPPVPNNYDPRMHNNRPPNNYDPRFYNNNRHPNNNGSGMHSDRFNNERYNNVFGDRIVEGLNDKPNGYHQRGNQLPPRLQPPSDNFNRARSVSPNPSFRDRNANKPNQQSRGYRTAGYF